MNYKYHVNTYADGDELTHRTNSVKIALDEFFENVSEGLHTDIVDGFTGEVLAIANSEGEDFATDEMALMMLGYMCAENWGECEDCDEPEEIEPDDLTAFLEQIVKLGGLPS